MMTVFRLGAWRLKRTLLKACVIYTMLPCLLWITGHALASETLTLPEITASSIDGSATASRFSLQVSTDGEANRLTSQSVLEFKLQLKPDAADIGSNGAVYAIFVKDNLFFRLDPNRQFSLWDGSLEGLTPFATGIALEANSLVDLFAGRLNNLGDYVVFLAFGVEGSSNLYFTPSPFVFNVSAADESPLLTQANALHASAVENPLLQTRCIACHVSGGLAGDTPLLFQRTGAGSIDANFSAFKSYIAMAANSAASLLTKATGGNSHFGGQQITVGSQEYSALAQVLELIELENTQRGSVANYPFTPVAQEVPPVSSQSLLSAVTLEPREATLRRATILFAGRAPTDAEMNAVESSDDALRGALRELMDGPQFKEFLVIATNDRLLIEGGQDDPINHNFSNFPILRNLFFDAYLNETRDDYYQKYSGPLATAGRRAAGELIAHVILNELPYSEILTADYTMMNPFMNQVLGGTAVFPANATADMFLPAKITQYYFPDQLEDLEDIPGPGKRVAIRGTPLAEYPHAGILSDFGFLSRYPTTATNRNRARARWTLFHFLGIDIEKSSQRPTDESALSDRNNPTMNNPACTVCHTVMDPVAGAFQNWSDFNLYRQDNGNDSLDGLYKWPADGSKSLYQQGDLWYRDMRAPGLFQAAFTSRNYTLRELANAIVQEPNFLNAAAQFWWPTIFGSSLIERPTVETDQDFQEKAAAYAAQQAAVKEFASVLGLNFNAKDMLVEMIMSPWFSATTTTNYEFRSEQVVAELGAERLLTPAQLATKTRNLTGVHWRTDETPNGTTHSEYDSLEVLLGGIDAQSVTERATLLTPSIMTILLSHAAETACPIVVKDFALPVTARKLFNKVSQTTTPLSISSTTVSVSSQSANDWKTHSIDTTLPAGGAAVNITFDNPWCDWDGQKCREQRVLFADADVLTLRYSSGLVEKYNTASPQVQVSGDNCYVNGANATFYDSCKISLNLQLSADSKVQIVARLAAQQAPSQSELVAAVIEVSSTKDILDAQTENAGLIKQQIATLFLTLHGQFYDAESPQVQKAYGLFAAALTKAEQNSTRQINNCQVWTDGRFFQDLLSPEQLALVRTPSPNGNYYEIKWDQVGETVGRVTRDTNGTKQAWIAVMAYMLSHYDYIHE